MKSSKPSPKTPRSSPSRSQSVIRMANAFPPAWLWLVDEALPTWVKQNYSPRDSWKNKPFAKEDAQFFFKGIEGLSDLFTEDRPKGMPQYFQHPKYRSAYLLYFLPLQAAKFLTLYQMYPDAVEAALKHARKNGVMRIADLGAGPGTASISLLLLLLNRKLQLGEELPKIELHWVDTNFDAMRDGQAIVEQLGKSFPKLRDKISVTLHEVPWWKAPARLPTDFSLTLMGHLLNESQAPQSEVGAFWEATVSRANGGGLLLVEPAARRPSQILSHLRNEFFESNLMEKTPARLWGPCLHAEICPLTDGRDWCHFSIPVAIPGKWFRGFSEALGSERQWVKFSYLWFASIDYPSPLPSPHLRRVISDPLGNAESRSADVLICEPEQPGRWKPSSREDVKRGDLIQVNQMKIR